MKAHPRDRHLISLIRQGHLVRRNGDVYLRDQLCRQSGKQISIEGKRYSLARVNWLIAKGPVPKGLLVTRKNLRSEDFSPENLILRDYYQLRKAEGDQGLRPRGSGHVNAKLDDDGVRLIRRLREQGWTYSKIKALPEFEDVSYTTIFNVGTQKRWVHLRY